MTTLKMAARQASSRLLAQQVPSMRSTTASKRDGLAVALCRNGRRYYILVRLVGRQLAKRHPVCSSSKCHPWGLQLHQKGMDWPSLCVETAILISSQFVLHTRRCRTRQSFSMQHTPMGLLCNPAMGCDVDAHALQKHKYPGFSSFRCPAYVP